MSNAMSHELKLLVRQFPHPQLHLRILFISSNTIDSHFSHEDKVPELTASNAIYKCNCNSCQAFAKIIDTNQILLLLLPSPSVDV